MGFLNYSKIVVHKNENTRLSYTKKTSYLCKKLSLNKFLVDWLPHQFEELKHGSPRCQNQPAKQKHNILINNNLEAFKTIDGTCTIPPISDISKFACAHVWSACVITRSLIVTFAGGCLPFINICRKIKKKQRIKTNKISTKVISISVSFKESH